LVEQVNIQWQVATARLPNMENKQADAISSMSAAADFATVVLPHDRPATIEPGVIEFLNSVTVLHWAEVTLGITRRP
jgi:hypothetical protein